jgi:hypothetical protein
VRAAGSRYSRSALGRRANVRRQQRFRARRRARVTHQSSASGTDGLTVTAKDAATVAAPTTTDPEDRDANHTETELALAAQPRDEAICHFCGRPCGQFTRFGFLEPLVRSRRRRHLDHDG